jgi:hypothetical protein
MEGHVVAPDNHAMALALLAKVKSVNKIVEVDAEWKVVIRKFLVPLLF